jgi:hypothetical protein
MNVTIALQHPHEHYTNLDVIQGKVILRVPNPTNISSIIVKLEGESKTRLLAPIHPNRPDKQRPVLEMHKFLYKTNTLFPTNVRPEELAANPKASFAINNGTYEYPFSFKVSFEMGSTCATLIRATDTSEHTMSSVEQSPCQRFLLQCNTRIRDSGDTPHQSHTPAFTNWIPW